MQNQSSTVVVLGTGGTIAGTAARTTDYVGYTPAQLSVQHLVQGIPAMAGVTIECEQVAQIDSKDMDHATWRALALRCALHLARAEVAGLVVTHGTDTLEETAWFLQRVLGPAKPVVLTGAMRPPGALESDGPQNLVDAVTVAREPAARGVVVAMAGRIHGAREVRKVHLDCLATIGAVSNPDQQNIIIGKAGRSRWFGIRPHTRGIAKNPVDHPHGGRTNGGKHWVTPSGISTKGKKTRQNKRTDGMILRRRHAAK